MAAPVCFVFRLIGKKSHNCEPQLYRPLYEKIAKIVLKYFVELCFPRRLSEIRARGALWRNSES